MRLRLRNVFAGTFGLFLIAIVAISWMLEDDIRLWLRNAARSRPAAPVVSNPTPVIVQAKSAPSPSPPPLPTPAQAPAEPFTLLIAADMPPGQADKKLVVEAARVFLERQPENAGREQTFPGLGTEAGAAELTGWWYHIKEAKRIPGGWRAIVCVAPRTDADGTGGDGAPGTRRHIEIYRYEERTGNLILEGELSGPRLSELPGAFPGIFPLLCAGSASQSGQTTIARLPAGPPGTPGALFGIPIFAVNLFPVTAWLEKPLAAQLNDLVPQVIHQLAEAKPENPGREKTFGPLFKPNRFTRVPGCTLKIRRIGWSAHVRQMTRAEGGWSAVVWIYAECRTIDGGNARINDHHVEVYTFKDGKLTMQSDSVDPLDPEKKGLTFGGIH